METIEIAEKESVRDRIHRRLPAIKIRGLSNIEMTLQTPAGKAHHMRQSMLGNPRHQRIFPSGVEALQPESGPIARSLLY